MNKGTLQPKVCMGNKNVYINFLPYKYFTVLTQVTVESVRQNEPQQGMNCERSVRSVNHHTCYRELRRWICTRSKCRTRCWSPANVMLLSYWYCLATCTNGSHALLSLSSWHTLEHHQFLCLDAFYHTCKGLIFNSLKSDLKVLSRVVSSYWGSFPVRHSLQIAQQQLQGDGLHLEYSMQSVQKISTGAPYHAGERQIPCHFPDFHIQETNVHLTSFLDVFADGNFCSSRSSKFVSKLSLAFL